MNRGGAGGAGGGAGGAMQQMGGAVSQYWKRHIADSVWMRLAVWLLAAFALLFQILVILGCAPGAPGSGSSTSQYYLLEFVAEQYPTGNNFSVQSVRLRVGYVGMCCVLNSGEEHCAITIGKDDETTRNLLSYGPNTPTYYDASKVLPKPMFDVAQNLQNNVFVILPAVPGILLALGVLLLAIYGLLDRPWVGPASSWRQSQRNRRLDIMRLVLLTIIGLAIKFSFAVAISESQLFAAVKFATGEGFLGSPYPGSFIVNKGTTALALHWLCVLAQIAFVFGIFQTHIEISSIKVKVTPEDTAGTTGGRQFQATGDTIEKASLLKDAEPMAINPAGLQPEVPGGGTQGAMGGQRGRGGRGGRGGPGGRGGGMRGGMGGRGRGRGM